MRQINLRFQKNFQSDVAKESIDKMESCLSLDDLGKVYHAAIEQHPEAEKALSFAFHRRKEFLEKSSGKH